MLWHGEKLGWNKKMLNLGLVPNSESSPSSIFFLFAPSEHLFVSKETWMEGGKKVELGFDSKFGTKPKLSFLFFAPSNIFSAPKEARMEHKIC